MVWGAYPHKNIRARGDWSVAEARSGSKYKQERSWRFARAKLSGKAKFGESKTLWFSAGGRGFIGDLARKARELSRGSGGIAKAFGIYSGFRHKKAVPEGTVGAIRRELSGSSMRRIKPLVKREYRGIVRVALFYAVNRRLRQAAIIILKKAFGRGGTFRGQKPLPEPPASILAKTLRWRSPFRGSRPLKGFSRLKAPGRVRDGIF